MTAYVDENNHLLLEGTARNAEHQAEIKIEQWDTFLSDTGKQMLGRWTADSVFANGFGMQHQREEYVCST